MIAIQEPKKIELPKLEYGYGALEPVISKKIMELHHDKHHLAYVNGANAALEKISKARKGEMQINYKEVERDLSFHLNGHILHSMLWKNMKDPEQNNKAGGKIGDLIDKNFGSFENFKKEFAESAKAVEGSGWALLAQYNDYLHILNIEKHNLMHLLNAKPILAIDVWEHAYYPDYFNDRAKYVEGFFSIINWGDVENRMEK